METPTTPQIQTSFIPKKTLTEQAPVRRSMPVGLLTVIAFIVLGLSIAALIFAYGYRQTLLAQINAPCPDPSSDSDSGCGLLATLDKRRNRLDPNLITQFRVVHTKTQLAKNILEKHATLIPLFSLLNETTLQTIQYQKFTFGPDGVLIDGVAAGYEDIALQSQQFNQHRDKIQSYIFSDLVLTDTGQVAFKLEMIINPEFLSYRKYRESRPSALELIPLEGEDAAFMSSSTKSN